MKIDQAQLDRARDEAIAEFGECDVSDRELAAILEKADELSPIEQMRHQAIDEFGECNLSDGELEDMREQLDKEAERREIVDAPQAIAAKVTAPKVSVNVDSASMRDMAEAILEGQRRLTAALAAIISRKAPTPIVTNHIHMPRVKRVVQVITRDENNQIIGSVNEYEYEEP